MKFEINKIRMKHWKLVFNDGKTQWQLGATSRAAVDTWLAQHSYLGKDRNWIHAVADTTGRFINESSWK